MRSALASAPPAPTPASRSIPSPSALASPPARCRGWRAGSGTPIWSFSSSNYIPNVHHLLLPLARELRLSLDELVPPAVPDPRVRRKGHTREGVTTVPLAPEGSPVQTVRLTFEPGPPPPSLRTHDGYEWLYVISGQLRLQLAEHDLVLGPGEAAEFDTRTPHALSCHGGVACELVAIFNAAGERIHTRAAPKSRLPRSAQDSLE